MSTPSIESLEALTHGAGAEALGQAMEWSEPGPAEVTRLRRSVPAPVAAAALEVAAARRSLRGRVAWWQGAWADREGAAQASDETSANWKATRFAGLGAAADLCCGIGADLRALHATLPTRGVDLRSERAWMAARNAAARCDSADATTLRLDERVAHLDPARRDEPRGARLHGWNTMQPDGAFVRALALRLDGLMVKLGPGVDIPADERPAGSELAFLSRGRSLTQAVLCTGSLARQAGRNTAVLLEERLELSGAATWSAAAGDPSWEAIDRWRRFIAEPDPSLERSGLLPIAARAQGLHERAPGLGLCTRDETPEVREPWFRWFETIATPRARLEDLQRELRARDAGIVEVKVRGAAADADAWSRALRGDGSRNFVVFVHRVGAGAEAVVARRL